MKTTALGELARSTGIEESRIRFYELEFQAVFEAQGIDLRSPAAPPTRIALLGRIHELLCEQGLSLAEIRSRLVPAEPAAGMHRARIIAVASGKGGVGKTSVSINLAVAMAGGGARVLLVDGDPGLGNVHVFLGVKPRGTLMHVLEGEVATADALTEGPGGIRLLCGESGVARMADLDQRQLGRLRRLLIQQVSAFDVILLDAGAGISAQVMSLLDLADDILVVTLPDIAAMLDAYGLIKATRRDGAAARITVLVNQAAEAQEAHVIADRIVACARQFLDLAPSVADPLPRDPALHQCNQRRVPVVTTYPDSAAARALRALARDLLPPAPTPAGGGRSPQTRGASRSPLRPQNTPGFRRDSHTDSTTSPAQQGGS